MAKSIKVKVAPVTGDPINGGSDVKQSTFIGGGRTPIDVNFDLRDRMMELVGKGNVLSPDEKAGIYGDLAAMVGKEKAQKLMDHAYIFNSRGDVQGLKPEDKINAFYNIGSHDPFVQEVIGKTKGLGYGVGPGFRTSLSQINQQLTGRVPVTASIMPTEQQRKIMVKIKK